MTATTFSLAELRAAYTALQAGTFTAAPNPTAAIDPALDTSTLVNQHWDPDLDVGLPAVAGPVVGVVGVSGGVGTTTVALAVAEALGAGRLVEFSDPHSSGLAAASTAELGIQDGWNIGVRHELRLERRTDPDASLLPGYSGTTVLDLGTWTTRPLPPTTMLVVVAGCSVPSARRLNARLEVLDHPVVVVAVISGVPGRSLPKPVLAAFGATLRTAVTGGRLLLVPECPSLRVGGVTADPLPRLLRSAVDAISLLSEEPS